MRLLLKASEERDHFHDLIYKEVTFASDIITIGGHLMHSKGEKAFISDVEYTSGYWSHLCPDIYVQPKISTFKINGIPSTSWRPETFVEFQTTTNDTTKGNTTDH
jgi:hypothetical protein